jgi:type IV/VI secretion system ImpK/VasF family protein
MTPEFSAAFDPLMLDVLGLLDRVRAGEAIDLEPEQARVRNLIEQGGARVPGSRARDWQLASYAVVALLDELLIVDIPWSGQSWWETNALEVHLFGARHRATAFYERADEAAGLANRDALEVFLTAVLLGFRGMLRDQRETLQTWVRRHEQLVRVGQNRGQLPDTGTEITGAFPLGGRSSLIWATLAVTMAAAGVIVTLWGAAAR